MRRFTNYLTLMGRVVSVDPDLGAFTVRCRSGDEFRTFVSSETNFRTLTNLDGLDRDRMPIPESYRPGELSDRLKKYVHTGHLLALQGIYQEYEGQPARLDAREVHLLTSATGVFLFEETHWWLTQTARLADEWLEDLFGDRRTYMLDDFAELYRSNLNIMGQETDDNIQECATLSRLIYGLSSSYLLTGSDRYLLGARAAVMYQREAFRSLTHDGKYCFWSFGRRKGKYGSQTIFPSQNPDDAGSLPLYEQIYALAGMTQFYRITADWDVLQDIRRTVRTFNDFYLDVEGPRGYFSHLDYATMRPDVEALGDNNARKNWNSIGDHIPAYLINLICALEPLPKKSTTEDLQEFLAKCKWMLDETVDLIVTKFPDPGSPYVNERFLRDWTPDHDWRWQNNRAIIGHNLKIAWNLTRAANYYCCLAESFKEKRNASEENRYRQKAKDLMDLSEKLAMDMVEHGMDQIRGGIFDAVERAPEADRPINFAWHNSKDFWQQEQAILAYYIVYGYTRREEYLDLARECSAFWNLFFLDRDNRGIFFRVTDNGWPVIQGNYANKAGHAIAGYHMFELNYLAHLYTRINVGVQGSGSNFCLFFKPSKDSGRSSINVLPDFAAPGRLKVASVTVNGTPRTSIDPDNFQIELADDELGSELVVEFAPQQLEEG